jgi:tetratricopeptide (TPR) repeat protein
MNTENKMQHWLDGQISLGTAANWERDEIRIVSEVAYSLAQQGRIREAIVLFEGLIAVAPATAYFQAALGALFLRLKDFPKAVEHLDAALKIDPEDIVSLANRGEAHWRSGNKTAAREDLEKALQKGAQTSGGQTDINDEKTLTIKRARALLKISQTEV